MRILKSLWGLVHGIDPNDRLIATKGFISGDHGSQFYHASPGVVSRFDDFTGATQAFSTTIIDGWRSRKGSDAACVDWTVTESKNGTVLGTVGNTTASMAVSGVQLDAALDWEADMGLVCFEARVQISRITNIALYVGLTDQTAALEMPIQSAASANNITTNCSDGCGFMFDTSMSTADWWLVGVKGDTDATAQDVGAAPAAATWDVLRIELDSSGNAVFFRNGLQVGSQMANAVTKTVRLTPVIAGFNRTTSGAPTISVDYVHASATRV